MKKVLSVVLALVMMLSVFSVSFASANTESDATMVVGQTKTVSGNAGAVYDGFFIVRYVAVGNGTIIITSDGESYSTCNPVIEIYKDSMKSANKIGDAENTNKTHNFVYELNVVAGTVYFFAMHNSIDNDDAKWDVTITCNHEIYDNGVCLTCNKECDHTVRDNIVGCCPCGDNYDGEAIVVGDKYVVDSDTDYRWFRFDVKETAPYILTSENPDGDSWGDNSANPAFIITDETGEIVLANDADISKDNVNFNFPFLFAEGERYFIGVKSEKNLTDDWYFTFANGTKHSIPEEYEAEEQKVDAEGNLVFEEKKDENGNVVYEEKKDENGNVVYEVEVDAEGNPVLDADGNPVYKTELDADGNSVKIPVMVPVMVPVMETVIKVRYIDHELKYAPQKNANHNEAGHTPYVYCTECKDENGKDLVIAGGDVIPQIAECVDANADNACDICGKVMVEPEPEEPEDPTKNCPCNCHKKGISKFFFDFALFFQKIFRLNSVCKCGIRHY